MGVEVWRVGRRRDDADALLHQERVHRRAVGHHDRHGEQHPGRGAHDVGIENVGHRIAHDHGVAAGGVRAAQDRAEVAGLLDGFDDQQEGVGRQLKVGQAVFPLRRHGEQAVGTFAVGDLGEGVLGQLEQLGPGLFRLFDQRGFVLAQKPLGTEIQLLGPDALLQRPADLPVALDQEQARVVAVAPLAQLDELFDPGVLKTGDLFRRHGPVLDRINRMNRMNPWILLLTFCPFCKFCLIRV